MFELIPLKKLGWPVNELALDWMDRFFDRFHSMHVDGVWNPSFDVSETDEHFLVKADLPGIDVKDLDISLDNGVLTVHGVKREEREEKGENFHRTERSFGSFCRSFTLPGDVKSDAIEAVYKDGVLRLTIPKAETSKRKKIEVKH